MVIDSSVLAAILLKEPERSCFVGLITEPGVCLLSAANALEAAMVVESRLGPVGSHELDILLHKAAVEIVAFDAEQFSVARQAWRKYGKGRHPAALNYGDCFAYALAKISNEPLLAKGLHFQKTDLQLL
ncbi:MAG: type II toxin-antitoxin system VapC family toxin [Candidatus Acidiferrum sp.]